MPEDHDLADKATVLLQMAIAIIAEEVGEIAVTPMSHTQSHTLTQKLVTAGDDITALARACDVLLRRAKTF